MANKPLNRYLQTFRRRAGLTQKEIAYLIDAKSRSTISKHESADSCPTFETLVCYELLFGIPMCDFLDGDYQDVADAFRERVNGFLFLLEQKTLTPSVKRKIATLRRVLGEDENAEAA
jgi:DNA-binding XRE family transcriptional regulator